MTIYIMNFKYQLEKFKQLMIVEFFNQLPMMDTLNNHCSRNVLKKAGSLLVRLFLSKSKLMEKFSQLEALGLL